MITSSYMNRECYEEDKTIYNSLLINCRGGGVVFFKYCHFDCKTFWGLDL